MKNNDYLSVLKGVRVPKCLQIDVQFYKELRFEGDVPFYKESKYKMQLYKLGLKRVIELIYTCHCCGAKLLDGDYINGDALGCIECGGNEFPEF